MSGFREYDRYDATGLAELVRKRKVAPRELCEEAIARIERLNPLLNAVITPLFDEARALTAGTLPKGPFTGVPFLCKDILQAQEGVRMSMGSRSMMGHVARSDSELVRRFRRAGMIILGRTNVPEFGLMPFTEPAAFGPARNPWNTGRTPGGSSGGSAAAVAAGIVPMAGANDGGGSIRIPAAWCGLFGLKPSRGRNPLGPEYGEYWQGAVAEHVLTRSVRDSAAMLDATCGEDDGAPYGIAPPERPFLAETRRSPGKLRIAFCTKSPLKSEVHHECVKAVLETCWHLERLGHRVEEKEAPVDGVALAKAYFSMYLGEVAADMDWIGETRGRRVRRDEFEPVTWILGMLGRITPASEFVEARRLWGVAGRAMGRFFREYDLYLTPSVACPPLTIGELQPKPAEKVLIRAVNALGLGRLIRASGMVDRLAVESLAKVPFTQLANLTGLPAMSVPLHWTEDGLPVGSHFMARYGNEALLFRLAAQLEKAVPWNSRRPGAV
ncbi:MAG: amidase [Spirochaetes bacterium]|nr:amidase [Spirochaetota bacterium]